ncbi:HD domain-containing protein [Candidatus Nomurabacteria bacterium]|nr:HD domain-containing protein [Candidatus Nomurabacteria bacterium]
MYSYKIEQAIKAASLLHQDQLRKGSVPLPYLTHLMAVTLILRDYTTDEDTLVAGLLHDTLEDTDYTYEELVEDFGEKVALIVQTLTEPGSSDQDKQSWLEIKKNYAKQLRKGPIEAVMIAAADKTHNFRSMVEDYYDDHNGFLREFGTHLDNRLEAYQNIANAINSRLADGIVHEFNHTFKTYKDFIFDVKDNLS